MQLLEPIRLFGGDLVDEPEQARLDELDEALVHLRLALEMTIECRLRNVELRRERGGRELLPLRVLQHLRQCVQDLQLPLSGSGRHGALPVPRLVALRMLRFYSWVSTSLPGEAKPRREPRQLAHRADFRVDVARSARLAAHPDRAQPEPAGRPQGDEGAGHQDRAGGNQALRGQQPTTPTPTAPRPVPR